MTPQTVIAPDEQSVTRISASIIGDVQDLIKQQVALARAELKADFRQTVRAASLLTWGIAVGVPAAVLLSTMFVYLLHEAAGLPRWAGYGIVGAILAGASAILIFAGRNSFRSIHHVPDQTVESFKENVRWMTAPK